MSRGTLANDAILVPIGLLALGDEGVLEPIETLLCLGQGDLSGFVAATLVGFLSVGLFSVQYCCSRQPESREREGM